LPPHIPKITTITRNKRFEKELKGLQPNIQQAAKDAIRDLYKEPIPAVRRLHSLTGYKNPKVYTIDVFSNRSYKISLEIDAETANLRRVATHKEIDADP
jgi:mRNA-degrading endonuclease RelE of RelBE toxin-antitoxin system